MRTTTIILALACITASVAANAQHPVAHQAAPLATLAAPPAPIAADAPRPRSTFGDAIAELTRSMKPAPAQTGAIATQGEDTATDRDAVAPRTVASSGN